MAAAVKHTNVFTIYVIKTKNTVIKNRPIVTCWNVRASLGDKNVNLRCVVEARPPTTTRVWQLSNNNNNDDDDDESSPIQQSQMMNDYWTEVLPLTGTCQLDVEMLFPTIPDEFKTFHHTTTGARFVTNTCEHCMHEWDGSKILGSVDPDPNPDLDDGSGRIRIRIRIQVVCVDFGPVKRRILNLGSADPNLFRIPGFGSEFESGFGTVAFLLQMYEHTNICKYKALENFKFIRFIVKSNL
ncbi:hypothetical protein HELRODRAFT_163777 [Helobdella robusta]|uniref:Uncharacterized protein n=1 Tax=Helobdella robusta TaxID=6412 RepID=T1EUG4_HELRO|nr:hypothetical protein HELRODRAFT_163777 [Helobdella robusta]ESN96678.1 hypothetical protein HELRODRAFT_163777 [Helobdella robusta]